jgi:hypothetical protein
VKRSQAAALIDNLREMAARSDRTYSAAELGHLLAQYDIAPLTICTGEAHSSPYIDNCGLCAPRWGFAGKTIRVT